MPEWSLDINVFTIIALLVLFLGLQLQIRGLAKKIDDVLNKK